MDKSKATRFFMAHSEVSRQTTNKQTDNYLYSTAKRIRG